MNVTLNNFRCHRHQTFTFASGLNLIEGKSGQGKTTILDAVSWCLLGKQRNVLTRGEKKCSVVLNLSTPEGTLTLTRTKLPSRLLAQLPDGQTLEDDAAQQYVYTLIGGENFDLTSYMLQKGTTQFFTLPATEKRRFIESLSKQHNNLDNTKERIQLRIKSLKDTLLQHQSRLELILQTKPQTSLQHTELLGLQYTSDLHLANQLSEKVKLFYSNEYSQTKKVLEDYLHQLSTLSSLKSQHTELSSTLSILQSQLSSANSRLHSLDYSQLASLESRIEAGQRAIDHQKKKAELLQAKKNYEDLVKQEEIAIQSQLSSLEKQLAPLIQTPENPQLEKAYQSLLRKREIQSKLLQVDISIATLEAQRHLVSSLKDIQQRKVVMGCPHCSRGLVIKSGAIAKADAQPLTTQEKESVTKLPEEEKKLSLLEKKYSMKEQLEQELQENAVSDAVEQEYKDYKSQLEASKSIKEKNRILQEQISNLKQTTAKDKFSSIRKQYEKELEVFKAMPKGESVDNLQDLMSKSKELQRVKVEGETTRASIADLQSKILQTRQQIDSLPKVEHIISQEEVESMQQTERSLFEKLSSLDTLSAKLSMVEEYRKERVRVKKWESSVCSQRQLVEMTQKELMSLETFLRKIVEAETKCLEETIRVLNRKVQEYLDKFFPEDPIKMELATEKEGKKVVKTEIALKLTYKSEECDLSSLSGGEYDRCALAFLLAVNEVCASPLLILDESIGSLDMANAENVLEVLKEMVHDKVVILVQHQATCGSYDHVVRV